MPLRRLVAMELRGVCFELPMVRWDEMTDPLGHLAPLRGKVRMQYERA